MWCGTRSLRQVCFVSLLPPSAIGNPPQLFLSYFSFLAFSLSLFLSCFFPHRQPLRQNFFFFYYFLRQEFFFERPGANTCLWKHRQFPFSLGTRLGCHIRGFKSMQCHLCNSAQFTQLTQQTMTNKFEEQNAAMQHGDHYL